jgi:hypothetical protein
VKPRSARGMVIDAMARERAESRSDEQAERIRALGREANEAAQRAAFHLARAAAALRAQGYGAPPRRGR